MMDAMKNSCAHYPGKGGPSSVLGSSDRRQLIMGLASGGDERAYLGGVFAARSRFHPADDVDTPGLQDRDRFSHILRRESACGNQTLAHVRILKQGLAGCGPVEGQAGAACGN